MRKIAKISRAPALHGKLIWSPRTIALERAMDFIELEIDEQTKALQAMLGARREAETRLADLEASLAAACAT